MYKTETKSNSLHFFSLCGACDNGKNRLESLQNVKGNGLFDDFNASNSVCE